MMPVMSQLGAKQRSVEFLSHGLAIRAVLRFPSTEAPHPIIILGHGLGGLKEWTLPEVADAFVQTGLAALWFDYRNFGDSAGEPRDEVSHLGHLEDWQSAISYASSLPEIDCNRIGIWGTSLGGRDAIAIAAIDRRVKAVVTQTPVIKWTAQGAARMAGFGDNIEQYYQQLFQDRQNRIAGKEPQYMPYVKPADHSKRAYLDSLSEAHLRNYSGRITLQSYQPTVLIDVTPLVELIAPTPILFIVADSDYLPGQREAYQAAKEPKSLVTVKGDHFSVYTTAEAEATAAAKQWFAKYLTTM